MRIACQTQRRRHTQSDFTLAAGTGNTLWLTGSPQLGATGTSFISRITLP